MNPPAKSSRWLLGLLLLSCLLSICNPGSAQNTTPTDRSALRSGARAPKASASKTPDGYAAPAWPPADVDESIPPVSTTPPCSLPQVLTRAGHRIEVSVHDLERFTATELVQHQKVDKAGRLHEPETSRFDYLVFLSPRPSGTMNVEEYRKGFTRQDQFPDHVATEGTPSLVLIFHPKYANNFSFTCEGLGKWHEKPAWQLRFEERDARRALIALIMGGHIYNVKIRGRAWILADSYEVARLETDLVESIPAVRLRLDHQSVEYGPVRFPQSKVEIWLPSSTELYMDFQGHRFYRRHSFTNFNLFSVKIDQQIGDPPGYTAE